MFGESVAETGIKSLAQKGLMNSLHIGETALKMRGDAAAQAFIKDLLAKDPSGNPINAASSFASE